MSARPSRPHRRLPLAVLAGAALAVSVGTPPGTGLATAAVAEPVGTAGAHAYDVLTVPLPPGYSHGLAVGLVEGPDGPVVVAVATDGAAANPATRITTYLWTLRTGHVLDVGELLGAPRVYAGSVASDGRLVGSIQRGGDAADHHWFVWSPAAPEAVREWPLLPAAGQPWLSPADVDASGRVHGDGGGWDVHTIAASWRPGGDTTRLSHRMSSVAQVNDAGQAVGNGTHPFGGQVAALWCDGREVPLTPRAGGDGEHAPTTARAISPAGLVTGSSRGTAVLWRDGTAVDLGTAGWGTGVNDAGVVVGRTGEEGVPATSTAWRALPGGRAQPLEGLLAPGTGWDDLWLAADVDEDGRIAGTGLLRGQERGFVLVPTVRQPRVELPPGSAQPACAADAEEHPPVPADPFELRPPLQPDGFDVEPGPASLTVRWLPTDYGHPLTGHRVVLEWAGGRRELAAPPEATHLHVGGLTDGTAYTVWLSARNRAGVGPHIGREAVPGNAWARQPYGACPPGRVPLRQFDDADGWQTVHSEAVHCARMWGVLRGTGPRAFDPAGAVTRGQAASALVRAVEAVGGALPADAADAFPDDDGSVHETALDRLAAAGLVTGTAAGRAEPAAPLTRGQLVSLLVRVLEHVRGEPLPASGDLFDDDRGGTHESAADRAGRAGVVAGTAHRVASPGRVVRRAEFASFAVRALDLLVEEGRAGAPTDPHLPAW